MNEPATAPIHVVGHVNPDTDAIAAAVGYAWLLARVDPGACAARAGALRPQTSWVLERLGLDAPPLLVDASPRFGLVAHRADPLAPGQRLADAWRVLLGSGRSVAPVVETDGRPHGLITARSLLAFLGQRLGPDLGRETSLGPLLDAPCRDLVDRDVPRFDAEGRIRDSLTRVLREERDDFWVVDGEGRYAGVCRKPDLLNPPRLRLVLVDHNEVGQAIGGLDEAELLEVLDHHRLDAPPTRLPIRFHVDPVGSTSTLVSERIEEAGLTPPPAIAGLLWAGLLSDTLMLRSPTTTGRDHAAAGRLAGWAVQPGAPLDGETQESFGAALLGQGTDLAGRAPADVVASDMKTYDGADLRFGIGQVEVLETRELSRHLAALQDALERLREQRGLDFALLMVTDIVRGASRLLLSATRPALLGQLPYPRRPDGTLEARGLVSRKKQLLPALLACLEG